MSLTLDSEDMNRSSSQHYSSMIAFKSRWITLGIALYWFIYWLMNGFDKFLAGKNMFLFSWYGNNRSDLFSAYFDKLDLSISLVKPFVIFSGLWELALAMPFIMAVDALFLRKIGDADRVPALMVIGIFFSVITFSLFSLFSVLAGDPSHLWQHSISLGLLVMTYIAMQMERMFSDVTESLK